MSVRAALVSLLLAGSAVVAVPSVATAQATGSFDEPPEYGADERHDPFDYEQRTDLMTEGDVTVGVDAFSHEDGKVSFDTPDRYGAHWYVSPVWMTFPHTADDGSDAVPDADGGALHDQYDGLALPIDADRYTHVSMRFHVAQPDPGPMYLTWFTCQEWQPQCQGLMKLSSVEQGWNTVSVPVSPNDPGSGLNNAWRGSVYGMRLQGVVSTSTRVTLDWFRLYDHDPDHEVTVNATANKFSYSNVATIGRSPSAATSEVWGGLPYPENNYNGTMDVNVSGLPPGTWYVFKDDENLGTVTIRPRPRPEILDPDMAGGVDYATEVLGNPWDFEDRGDFVRIGNASGIRLSGSELSAVNTSNDPYVELPLGPDGLDPVHYHRVTVDQHYDSAFNLDDGARATNPIPGGSHGRLLWRTARHPQNWRECAHVSDGREFVFYKTWDQYTYDMSNVPDAQGMSSSAEPNIGVDYCAVTGPDPHWTANGPLNFLRFDPHEAPSQYRWYVDDLRIAADDAANPTFDITWVDHQSIPGTEATVRLDTNRSGYDGEVLARTTQKDGKNRVTFDATDRLPGAYWVNITSRTPDGRVGRDYATGPLQVSPRLAGKDRVATAVDVSRQSFDGARAAIVASSEKFPDALVAVQLADAVQGPVLLTGSQKLDGRVTGELERLGVREVVIAGGRTALAPKVEQQLRTAGFRVTRIGGATRYETAANIAREAMRRRGASTAKQVLVTTGENFPDALAAGPFVGYSDTPLVLARPAQQAPPPAEGEEPPPPTVPKDNDAARAFLGDVKASRATFLGGPDALSDPVVRYVARTRDANRIAGSDRFVTARKLTAAAVDAGGSAGDVLVATGRNYPDALSAGPAALARGGVLALTEKDGVPAPTKDWLGRVGSWSSWRVVGGPVAVSHATVRDLRRASGL